jgi:hypothetical protein
MNSIIYYQETERRVRKLQGNEPNLRYKPTTPRQVIGSQAIHNLFTNYGSGKLTFSLNESQSIEFHAGPEYLMALYNEILTERLTLTIPYNP